jgi:hypothetical protein
LVIGYQIHRIGLEPQAILPGRSGFRQTAFHESGLAGFSWLWNRAADGRIRSALPLEASCTGAARVEAYFRQTVLDNRQVLGYLVMPLQVAKKKLRVD